MNFTLNHAASSVASPGWSSFFSSFHFVVREAQILFLAVCHVLFGDRRLTTVLILFFPDVIHKQTLRVFSPAR